MKTIKKFTDEIGRYENEINPYLKSIRRLPIPYTGNKRKMLYSIYKSIKKHDIEFNSVIDAFSGSGAVSLLFKSMNKYVISNDILTSSYINSVAFLGQSIRMQNNEQDYLLFHINPNKNTFVEDNYLGSQVCSRYNKFTKAECQHLDNFRANLDDLKEFRLQCLGLAANTSIVMRLPFGGIDASIDIIKHRNKQKSIYGSGGSKHDRRIGIYYDSEMNLNFTKWFKKYVLDFASINFSGDDRDVYSNGTLLENIECAKQMQESNNCVTTNLDIIDLLNNEITDNVDCVYFDPPYGGQSSDYASMYRFFEEYIYSQPFEDLPHYNKSRTFVSKKGYEDSFVNMLDSAQKIPIWMFSYNNSSWRDIDQITRIIGQYGRKVIVETLTDDYKYLYRENRGKTRKGSEYLILVCSLKN